VARLNAASGACEVVAAAWRSRSKTYAWQPVQKGTRFKRVSLLGTSDVRATSRHLLAVLHEKLNPMAFDLVAVNGWGDFGSLAVLTWASQHKIPVVVMSESTAWDEPRKAWKEFIKRQIVTLGAAALAGGKPHRDYMVKLGMPVERIFLGYDAVDNEYFAQGAKKVRDRRSETRQKYGLPKDYFFASARFVAKKNLPRLLHAYARYRELCGDHHATGQRPKTAENAVVNGSVVPWSLVLLGDGELRESLLSLRSSLGLEPFVHLPGFIQYPDLPAYYGLAKAFVHSSTTEQWGLVVNEAMASGLPVLVSNRCGCAPDLVQEGVNGFTFDPRDVEQLAQLMLKLSKLNSQLSTIGAASARIISDWGPERFAQGLKSAAETALAFGPAKASLTQRAILRALEMK
jgi:1,2-diacylglycerol 3-alpha-glucosyltransferase